ncbi:hypothetical protein [Amycolatopsis sp. CA-126428]|uniref:hypothetical protein n=1 Tax=Amycolatopsis sp. CA-126428 TaxID=2073158 RepID=UPI000CD2FF73|nr:hypothetical protein [Amycolatopsis sp. CA-126428]
MNEPIDVDTFVAQLADDDQFAREVASLSAPADSHPRSRFDTAVEIAALQVDLWALDARDGGDWSEFRAHIRECIAGAFAGLAPPETFEQRPGDGQLHEIEQWLWEQE